MQEKFKTPEQIACLGVLDKNWNWLKFIFPLGAGKMRITALEVIRFFYRRRDSFSEFSELAHPDALVFGEIFEMSFPERFGRDLESVVAIFACGDYEMFGDGNEELGIILLLGGHTYQPFQRE